MFEGTVLELLNFKTVKYFLKQVVHKRSQPMWLFFLMFAFLQYNPAIHLELVILQFRPRRCKWEYAVFPHHAPLGVQAALFNVCFAFRL